MSRVKWREGFDEAGHDSRETGKSIFIFFQQQDCPGCERMRDITFKDPEVAEFMEDNFVPLAVDVAEAAEVAEKYNISWTPCYVIADTDLSEIEQFFGVLSPEDFIPSLRLSRGLASFHHERFTEAAEDFEWVVENTEDKRVVPKARYYLGLSRFKETNDPEHLAKTIEFMKENYPGNQWTKKASQWAH